MACLLTAMYTGSPPLTRGQLQCFILLVQIFRITPAHAGTTEENHIKDAMKEDHPRSRGDNSDLISVR